MTVKHKNIKIIPCETDWYDMDQREDGNRFCQSCQKVVFDMAEMTGEEAEAFVKANPGCCGNFYQGQVAIFDGSDREGQTKRTLRNANWKKAIAAAAALAMLHGQMPAESNLAATNVTAIDNSPPSDDSGKNRIGPGTNTLLSGIVVDQNGHMVLVPVVLKVYLGSELIGYPVEVNHGLFSIDLEGKALPSDRITIVVSRQLVNDWKFAKTKFKTLLGEGQNLTVKSEVISRPPMRRGGGRVMYLHEI